MDTPTNTTLAKRSLRVDALNTLLCAALETGSPTPVSQTIWYQARANLQVNHYSDAYDADDELTTLDDMPTTSVHGLKPRPTSRSAPYVVNIEEADNDSEAIIDWDHDMETLCGDIPTGFFTIADDCNEGLTYQEWIDEVDYYDLRETESISPFSLPELAFPWKIDSDDEPAEYFRSPVLPPQDGNPIIEWASKLSMEDAQCTFSDDYSDSWFPDLEDEPAEYFRSPVLPPPSLNDFQFQPSPSWFGGGPFQPALPFSNGFDGDLLFQPTPPYFNKGPFQPTSPFFDEEL